MLALPKSDIQANFFADTGEKGDESWQSLSLISCERANRALVIVLLSRQFLRLQTTFEICVF